MGISRIVAGVTPGRALLVFLVAAIAMQAMGPLVGSLGLFGYAIAQALCFAGPALLAGRWREDLGITPPRPLALAGALAVGLGLWALLLGTLLRLQEWLFPMPQELLEDLQQLARPEAPVWVPLLCVALAPAIGEELLCRGLLLRAFSRRWGASVGIFASAFAFALLHVSPYRLAPTFVLGLALGAVASWSGSVVPAMLVHFLNNAAVILVGDRLDTEHPLVPILAAALVIPGALLTRRLSPDIRSGTPR
jgi:sodium transport system permease protein